MSKQVYSVPFFWLSKCGLTKSGVLRFSQRDETYFDEQIESYCRAQGMAEFNIVAQKMYYHNSIFSWKQILSRTALHIFIETKELYDFLISQEVKAEKVDFNLEGIIASSYDIECLCFDGKTRVGKNVTGATIVIHHKYIARPSIIYTIVIDNIGKDNIFLAQDKEGAVLINALDGASDKDSSFTGSPVAREYRRLLFNTLFYIEAFPNCISDGAPEEMKLFTNYYGADKRIKLKTHESLIEHTGITPHFRRGYFKRLTAECFTKKRGQVIFVHSTFVKGHAKTVLDSAEAREEMAI